MSHAPAACSPSLSPPAVHYDIEIADLHAHLFRVTLTLDRPAALQRVSLPVWIPGSYLVREFAKHLQGLTGYQIDPHQPAATPPLAIRQIDKCTWEIACDPGKQLVLCYQIYAHDASVRTAWLDAQRGFFNGTSVCLRVEGQTEQAHGLTLPMPPQTQGWAVATGLSPVQTDAQGFGEYRAAHYEELVDCPVELGAFWQGEFRACGVPHRLVVAGAPASFDAACLLADAQKICEAQIRFWHGTQAESDDTPFDSYVFMLNVLDEGYGGLEHRNSTALIASRKDLPRLGETRPSEGYTTLLGLISHEYFHTWNVKRLRPAEFAPYQYDRENYTQLLWFFEGFTSYYDDLLLRRVGLIDNANYLKLLGKTVNQVLQAPGRAVQSVAQASFDAWVKYYRPDENTPNASVSYYAKGALLALCLDLTLRSQATDGATLDAVMRVLWLQCKGGPVCEADIAQALSEVGGRSFTEELTRWVHGCDELPLQVLLEQHGVKVLEEPAQLAQRLGLRVSEAQGALHIKTVLSGGAAQRAGFAAGDEWLGVALTPSLEPGWRMSRLDDLLLYVGEAAQVTAWVARDKRLLPLTLDIPPASTTWRLAVGDEQRLNAWLAA